MLPRTIHTRQSVPRALRVLPWLVIAAILGATVIAMRLEGRIWWCEEGDWSIWISNVWTSHCSQHWFDPYSITHMAHGLIFFCAMVLLAHLAPRWSVPQRWRLCVAIGIAAAWEVLENSPIIINRYRTATMSLDYLGDSIANAVGDIVACAIGFAIARRIGWKWSLGLLLATEIVLLFLIRDNLTLNVIMLIRPIEAVKQWQAGGAG